MDLTRKFLTFCTRVVNRIRRIMSSESRDIVEFVDRFLASKETFLTSPEDLVGDYVKKGWDARNLCIRTIQFCKMKTVPYHEFLMVEVIDSTRPGSKEVGWMLVERCQEKEAKQPSKSGRSSPESPSAPDPQPSPPRGPSSSSSSGSLSGSFGGREALDRVGFAGKYGWLRHPDSKIRQTWVIPPTARPESILHLIAACSTVHKFEKNYRLMKYNCYWYAGVVFELLSKSGPGVAQDDGEGLDEDLFTRIEQEEDEPKKTGKAGPISVVSIKDIKKDATAMGPLFQEEIDSIRKRMTDVGGKADRAEEQAEAERQRAEAERQRAEAERQRAEAAKQQAEAEKKRAEAAEARNAEWEQKYEELRLQLGGAPVATSSSPMASASTAIAVS